MIKKFQLGGGVPQVFNIEIPQQPRVDLGSVIQTASMPIDAGVQTYSQLKNVEFNNERIKIEKDREERLKAQEKINNLKIISEFADKSSQWGVLPGDQAEMESILGELNDPALMARAMKDPNATAEYISNYVIASGKMNPALRRRKIYDEAVKQHTDVYEKYLDLIPNAADVLDTEFGQKMEEWSNRLGRFANGDPTVSQTSITPAGMGIEKMISPEGLKEHVEKKKQIDQSKLDYEKVKMNELSEEIKTKEQLREGLYNAAKERLKIQIPNDQLTPKQDQDIRAEIVRQDVELKIAKTNNEIESAKLDAAKTAQLSFENVGLKLKNISQWSTAASAINMALPAGIKVLEQDLSDLDAVIKSLKPEQLEDFFRSIKNNKEFNNLFSTSKDEFTADYRSYLDYVKKPGNENITYPEFKSTNSSVTNYGYRNVNGGTNNVATTKDGTEVNAARIGGTWVQNDSEFKKKYKDSASFVVTQNPATGIDTPYMMFSHTDSEDSKKLLHDMTNWAYVDEGLLWLDLDVSDFDTTKVPGSFHKDGILYVPIPDTQGGVSTNKTNNKASSKSGAPNVVPKQRNYVPDYVK
jgi:hypothetical protein